MEDYVKSLQKDFMPEDTQTGMIQAFLDNYEEDYVCSTIIYQEVFHQEGIVPKWQSKEIGDLMDNEITGWEKHGNHRFSGGLGTQRSWKRIRPKKDLDLSLIHIWITERGGIISPRNYVTKDRRNIK